MRGYEAPDAGYCEKAYLARWKEHVWSNGRCEYCGALWRVRESRRLGKKTGTYEGRIVRIVDGRYVLEAPRPRPSVLRAVVRVVLIAAVMTLLVVLVFVAYAL